MQLTSVQIKALEKLVSVYKIDADLSNVHHFFKSAGRAAVLINTSDFLVPKEVGFSELLKIIPLPIKIYGSRTNTLITESGFNGIFVIDDKPLENEIAINYQTGEITCEAALPLLALVRKACEAGFNLGALAGIPGTVGAAVFGNAGAGNTNRFIGDFVKEFDVLNLNTNIKETIICETGYFSMRRSGLQSLNERTTNYYIFRIKLLIEFIGQDEALAIFNERMKLRANVNIEGFTNGTAGSFWANRELPEDFKEKNPGVKVRDLICQAGLDKLSINGAHYTKNYIFLATEKETTDHDVASLLDITINTLQSKFGITPHKEVEILSKDGTLTVDEYIQKYK